MVLDRRPAFPRRGELRVVGQRRRALALGRDRAALLAYLVAEDRIVVWVDAPRGSGDTLIALVRRVPRDRVWAAVAGARVVLARQAVGDTLAGDGARLQTAVQFLSETLLPSEARRLLPASGEVVVVPDRALAELPFAILDAPRATGRRGAKGVSSKARRGTRAATATATAAPTTQARP